MIYKLYYSLSQISFPFIRLWVSFRKRMGKECPTRYAERFGKTTKNLPEKVEKRIWVHAASIGETVSVIPLIKKLEARGIHVILTTITRTSAQIAEQRMPKTIHQFVPYDHPFWIKRFLAHWQPNALILIESEFWPNLIMETAKKHIPIHLINARFSPTSFDRWRKYGAYFKEVFEKISFATTPHKKNLGLLTDLGVQFCRYMPNLKFMAKPLPFDKDEKTTLKKDLADRNIWVGASIRSGEESVFADMAHALSTKDAANLSVLIPRHPHVVEKLKAICDERNLSYTLRSSGKVPTKKTDVWIIDTFGELGLFFSLTHVVVMGGTFANCGSHNPIEPIMLGAAVILGPSRHNFLDVIEILTPALTLVDTKEQALNALEALLASPKDAQRLSTTGKEICDMQAAILEELPEYISDSFQKKIPNTDNETLTKHRA